MSLRRAGRRGGKEPHPFVSCASILAEERPRDTHDVQLAVPCGTAGNLDEVDPELSAMQIGCSEEQVQQLLASTKVGSIEVLRAEAGRAFALVNP